MKPLVFLDTETTSLEEGRLVQLAMRRQDGSGIVDVFKPPVPIDYEAMAVHHITQAQADENEPFGDQERTFIKKLIDGAVVVAHNAPFDLGVMEREGVVIPEWICSKKVAMRLWPDWPSHKLQYIRYRLGVEVKAGAAHDALADVIVLEAVFERMLKEAWRHIDDDGDIIKFLQQVSREPSLLVAVTFGKHRGATWEAVAKADRGYLDWILSKGNDFDEDVRHTAGHWLNETMPKPKPSPQKTLL